MALLTLVIVLVLVTELFNTALEAVVNLVTEEWEGYAKIAKDVSAGAVLMTSLGAVIIGCIIFVPRVLLILAHF
jgi:diacylglycerol kinase